MCPRVTLAVRADARDVTLMYLLAVLDSVGEQPVELQSTTVHALPDVRAQRCRYSGREMARATRTPGWRCFNSKCEHGSRPSSP